MTAERRKRAALVFALFIATFATLSSGAAAAPTVQLVFQPSEYDFGVQPVHSGAQASLQLRNEGEVPAPIYSLGTTGQDSGSFWVGGGDCSGPRTLQPNESCTMQVYFNPDQVRPYETQLQVASEENAIFTARLSGEGGRSVFTPATDPTNFGSIAVGASAVDHTIDFTNTGNMPGGVFIAVISGGAVGSFHLLDENCTNTLLSPAATCNAVVAFQPISTGAKTARLSLFGESDGGAQATLTGVGLEPDPATADTADPAVVIPVKPHSKRRVQRQPRRHRTLRWARRRRADLAPRHAIG